MFTWSHYQVFGTNHAVDFAGCIAVHKTWGAFHQAFCQCFSLTNFISYWNPCIWLAESEFVSEKHWQNAWWIAPLASTRARTRRGIQICKSAFIHSATSPHTLERFRSLSLSLPDWFLGHSQVCLQSIRSLTKGTMIRTLFRVWRGQNAEMIWFASATLLNRVRALVNASL